MKLVGFLLLLKIISSFETPSVYFNEVMFGKPLVNHSMGAVCQGNQASS